MFIQVLSGVAVLFVIILIGALSKLRGLITEDLITGLSKIVVVITLPFLYFYTLATESSLELIKSTYVLPLFAIFFVLIAYLIGFVTAGFLKLEGQKKSTFIYLATFTNCGFLAIPIAFALFGEEAVTQVVIFNIGFNLLYWTLGVWTLQEKAAQKNPLKNLLNSGTIALIAGLLIGIISLKLPKFFLDASKLIGDITIPLAMIVVGTIIGDWRRLKESSSFNVMASLVLIRLVVAPMIAFMVLKYFDLPYMTKCIIMLQAAMPSASTTPLFTKRFGGDPHLASSGVFITTLISIITIPIFMSLVK